MNNKRAQELRDLSVEELQSVLLETSKELFELRNELSRNKKIDKKHLLQALRRKRARTLTVLKEKAMAGNP